MNKHLHLIAVLLFLAQTSFCQLIDHSTTIAYQEMRIDQMEMHRENYMENAGIKSTEATGNNKLGIQAMNMGKYDEALSYFNKAIAVDITYQAPYHNRGLIEYHMHNLKAAIDDFEQAISLQSIVDIRTLNILAHAKFDYGDYKGCVKTLDKIIKLNPRDSKPWLRKGMAQNKLKDYKKAEETLSQAIELDSYSSDAYLNKGIAEMNLNKNVEALNDLTKARQMGNRGTDSLINVLSPGNSITTQPLVDLPKKTVTNVPTSKPSPPDANTIAAANRYNAQGVQNAMANDLPTAIRNFDLAISLNPLFAGAYSNRGNAKRAQKDYAGAMDDLNKAIELNPNYSVAYITRGRVEAENNKKDAACLDFNKAKQMGNRGADQYISQYCQ